MLTNNIALKDYFFVEIIFQMRIFLQSIVRRTLQSQYCNTCVGLIMNVGSLTAYFSAPITRWMYDTSRGLKC